MENREQINSKTFEMLDNENIKEIEMRTIGLLDLFGKIEIDIKYNDNSMKKLVGISPIDRNDIKKWLKTNNLYEKAKLYKF